MKILYLALLHSNAPPLLYEPLLDILNHNCSPYWARKFLIPCQRREKAATKRSSIVSMKRTESVSCAEVRLVSSYYSRVLLKSTLDCLHLVVSLVRGSSVDPAPTPCSSTAPSSPGRSSWNAFSTSCFFLLFFPLTSFRGALHLFDTAC